MDTTITESNEGSAQPEKVSIPVKLGVSDERVVEIDVGRSARAILEIAALERGCSIEELVLVREGEDGHIAEDILITAEYPHNRRHHVHHLGEVRVTVFYQSGSHERSFKRSATVEDVLVWAIDAFKVDASLATEMELVLHGRTDELPSSEHVGHLAGRHQELGLDLVRGDIANGSSP